MRAALFQRRRSDGVLMAVLYEKPHVNSLATVTNFVEFCNDLRDKRCFAAALYMVHPSPYSMDEIQFFVWLEKIRISDDRFEYRKLWEYRTCVGVGWGSLSVVDPTKVPWITSCVLVKTSEGNAHHAVQMRMFCLDRSDYPEILWEYNGDYCGESTGQAFRKSIVTFKDIDNDHINELILDTVEGYIAGWEGRRYII